MRVFTDEFKNALKQWLMCSWLGHKPSVWMPVFTSHFVYQYLGYEATHCERCRKELRRRNADLDMAMGITSTKEWNDEDSVEGV